MALALILFSATFVVTDAAHGLECLATFEGHISVRTLALSPDGNTIVTGCVDRMVRIFDAKTGKLKTTIKGNDGAISSVTFSPDGKHVVTSNVNEGIIRFYSSATLEKSKMLQTTAGIHRLRFSPDRKIFAAACYDNTVVLWDTATDKQIAVLKGHKDFAASCVLSLAFSVDNKFLATAGRDGLVVLWDLEKKLPIFKLPSAREKQTNHAVAFSKRGLLVSAADADRVIFWNTETGTEKKRANLINNDTLNLINDMRFSSDGEYLVVVGFSGGVHFYHLGSEKIFSVPNAHANFINCLEISDDGRMLITGSDDGTARLWRIKSQKD